MKLHISFPFPFTDSEHEGFFAAVLHETGTAYPPNVAEFICCQRPRKPVLIFGAW